jgi:hypothetical protein
MKNFQLLRLAFLLLILSFLMTSAHAQSFEQRALEEALNPDGTLKSGVNGSFKTDGYQMRTGPNGEPIFEPQTQSTVSGTWDAQFRWPNGVNAQVRALAFDGQGHVYVGGSFNTVSNISTPVNYVARYDVQTGVWSALGTGSNNGVNELVVSLAIDGQGRVYAGGNFTQAGGVSANRIARFDPATNTWSALGTGSNNGANGSVRALAIDGSGRVYAGGTFTEVGGVSASRIARFDPASNTWSTLGSGSTNGVSGQVNALAIDAQGSVYVGGVFTQAGSVTGVNRIARFDPATNSWSALGTGANNGVNNDVHALAIDGSGRVYVGGSFTQAGSVTGVNRIARFDPATNSWSTLGSGSNNGVNSNTSVEALAIDAQGRVYAGGTFTQAGGVTVNRIARFDPNNSATPWSALGSGSNIGVSGGSFFVVVNALAIDGSGRVHVGGFFSTAGNVSANNVARFDPASNTWSVISASPNNGVNGSVNVLAIDGSGRVYAGGSFISASNLSVRRIARFNPAINTWSEPGISPDNGVNGSVNALAIDGSGRVYVGGNFDRLGGGTSANRIARFDPANSTWSALGTGVINGVNADVHALAIDGSGGIYIGGAFTSAFPGGVSASRVVRYNPANQTWSALGTGANNGVNGQVNALAIDPQGRIYVGGSFTQAGSVSANRIARFDPNNSTAPWSALGTGANNGVNGDVRALAIDPQGRVYVGGSFTEAGSVTGVNRIARFDPNNSTTPWSALGTGANNGVNGDVRALAIDAQGRVYVGGSFTQAGSVTGVNRIARFDPASSTWSALGTGANNGVNGQVNALAIDAQAGIYMGGLFTQAGDFLSTHIAKYTPFSATRTVSANGLQIFLPAGVQIFFNGVSGIGTCTVERYDTPAQNVSFLSPTPASTSQYRFVITATGFTFTNAELRFNRTLIPNAGITNANSVRVYRRPTPGTGAFSILPNAYNASFPDEVRATTTAFSEFILGSNDNQLPVELTEFGFRKVDFGIELHWKTATELNNSGFEIERKSQGGNWTTLGFVRGAGTTTEAQSYSFLDRTASGKVQYRLKQIDFDGQFEYSNIIEVDAGLPKQFALEQNYPNPFNPTTTISYQLPVASQVSLKVYDVLGREVMTLVNGKQEAGVYNLSLNGATLSSGIYFYRLQSGNFVQTKKMMLVK